MPRDKDDRWTPEPHRAETYTPEQIQAGTRIATDFDNAAISNAPILDAPKAPGIAATTTIQTILTPEGSTRLQPNVQQIARQRAAALASDQMREEAVRDGFQHWHAKQLTVEFEKAQNKIKSKDIDLER